MTRAVRDALMCVALFCVALGVAWRSGAIHSEFGQYSDEGMHYITGLLVQDYVTSGHWSHPMQFATQYYLHFPEVALGNWPPGFSVMQAAWGIVFGVSRASMLFGMTALTAWLAFLVYRAAEKYFGPLWAALGAVLLITAPLTQAQTAMVMAEIPLAAVSFLAICAFVRFLESTRTRDAVAFALWTFAAIMIKGNGWVIVVAAPLILAAARKLALLRNARLWLAASLIGILCVPYTLVTMSIVTQGWDAHSFPGFAREWASLAIHSGFVVRLLGIPITAIAVVGAFAALVRRSAPSSRRDPFWIAMAIYGAAIVVFHGAIPSSIEPRKVYQIMPVMCLLALYGLDTIAAALLRGSLALLPWARPALAGLVLLVFTFTGFSLLPPFDPGFSMAVQNVMARPESRGAAILISSNPVWYDYEAGIIAEWASRRRNDGVFLIRGRKLLSHPSPQSELEPNFSTPPEVLAALSAIPVSFVILHTASSVASYAHHAQLKAALNSDPLEWEPIYHTSQFLKGLDQTHDIEIYRCKRNFTGIPIRYSVDLSKKLGAGFNRVE
jgi:hypothetical protein